MGDVSIPQSGSPPTRKKGLIAIAAGTAIVVVIVVVVIALSSSGPMGNAGVQSWAHKVVYANPSLILLQADISQTSTSFPPGQNADVIAICSQDEAVVHTIQHGPYPPVPSISVTYERYLSAAAAMYRACVVGYKNPSTAAKEDANLVKQDKQVVLIGDQLSSEVQARGGSLAPPIP
jgi:hypothetical protein